MVLEAVTSLKASAVPSKMGLRKELVTLRGYLSFEMDSVKGN